MPTEYTTEELIINDSFINYCLGRNEEDVRTWEEMILSRPEMEPQVREATEIVLGLHVMLRNSVEDGEGYESLLRGKKVPLYRRLLPYAAVFAVLVSALAWLFWPAENGARREDSAVFADITGDASDSSLLYVTRMGERKFFVLPDSTRIYLGAGSSLRLGQGFADTHREVFLSGEALFDVPSDPSRPFIVHSKGFDVNVIGTLFNVKAYPDEEESETSLVRGKVEVAIPGKKKRLPLYPNQKLILTKDAANLYKGEEAGQISFQPLSYSTQDSAVLETVWAIGRLEIVNESFGEFRRKLERWYNVKINISDSEVEDYTFTATFKDENIGEILKVLQHSYYFNYQIKGNTITISK